MMTGFNGKQTDIIDTRYHCVCVEQTDFRPILFEDVIRRIEAEGGVVGFKNGNNQEREMTAEEYWKWIHDNVQ